MISIEYYLLIGSILVLLSIGVAKFSENLGIPILILFLGVGMLAGSEGIGDIYFDDARIAQSIGIVALVFILFAGGLDTDWQSVKPILRPALSLATIGVILTAALVGLFVHVITGLPLKSAFLLGSIISSTDAAAVFSVLRAKSVSLKGNLKPLLELESGSNDPMAVFLTIGFIQLHLYPDASILELVKLFFLQMGIGAAAGFTFGKLLVYLFKKFKSSYEGIYLVFSLSFVVFTYSFTALLNGSGFLAVYLAGIIINNNDIVQKKNLNRFFDGLAWLSQTVMFVTLGLLVFPSKLYEVIGIGLLLSFILMFIARPISVYVSLLFSKLNWRDKTFISWVGLRGAVPIILATFPLMSNIPNADYFFSLVFFIVLTSTIMQGWSLGKAAALLKVNAPFIKKTAVPIELAPVEGFNAELLDFYISYSSKLAGQSIIDLNLPKDTLIVLINRNEEYIVPGGGTIIEQGDILLTLVTKSSLPVVQTIFSQ